MGKEQRFLLSLFFFVFTASEKIASKNETTT